MTTEFKKNIISKKKESMTKFNSAKRAFEKKQNQIKADLKEANRVWSEVSKRFRWWQTLP